MLPWDAAEYGRRYLRFNKLYDLERAWAMMAHLHTLYMGGEDNFDAIGAKVCQFMKSIECAAQCQGRWDLAWLYAGLPEPRPRALDRGLAHPVEFAANVAYLKELRTVEDVLRGKMGKDDDEGDELDGGGGGNGGRDRAGRPKGGKKGKDSTGKGANGGSGGGAGSGSATSSA